MAFSWNSASTDKIKAGASQTGASAIGKAISGIEAALTKGSGTSDPSATANDAWGAAEVGYPWLDTTAPDTPKEYLWQQRTAVPAYGFRPLRRWKTILVTTPASVLDASGTAAVTATDLSLAATFDGAGFQDTNWNRPLVRAALLRLRCRFTTNTHPGGDKLFLKVYEKGTTNEIICRAQVVNVWNEIQAWVGVDSAEKITYEVDTDSAGNSVAYKIDVMGLAEET